MTVSKETLSTLRRLVAGATEGPWDGDVEGQYGANGERLCYFVMAANGERVLDTLNANAGALDFDGGHFNEEARANAYLVAALRNSARQLLDDAERLQVAEAKLLRIAEIINAELPDAGAALDAIGDVIGVPF